MNLVKTTLTFEDGSVQEFDAAPASTPVPVETTEVDLLLSDGSTKKFVPAQ